eukprot:scaffold19198_cov50-Prasinocladus_malaysianus.AAC.1
MCVVVAHPFALHSRLNKALLTLSGVLLIVRVSRILHDRRSCPAASHIPGALCLKFVYAASCSHAVLPEKEQARQRSAARHAARLEGRLALHMRQMATVVDETIANVEKKQARTYDELQAELEEAQEQPISDAKLFVWDR